MFPGLTTKASESRIVFGTTIYPKTDIVTFTDTTATTVCTTISPPFGGSSGVLMLINLSGATADLSDSGGNISVDWHITAGAAVLLVYSKQMGLWYQIGS